MKHKKHNNEGRKKKERKGNIKVCGQDPSEAETAKDITKTPTNMI